MPAIPTSTLTASHIIFERLVPSGSIDGEFPTRKNILQYSLKQGETETVVPLSTGPGGSLIGLGLNIFIPNGYIGIITPSTNHGLIFAPHILLAGFNGPVNVGGVVNPTSSNVNLVKASGLEFGTLTLVKSNFIGSEFTQV
jgi:hypothetical protein